MRILCSFKCMITILSLFFISACGGSGNTSGSLVLSLPTSVAAGKSLAATATLTSTTGRPLNNLNVKYYSDNGIIIPEYTDPIGTTLGGVSQVLIPTKNVLSTVATVGVYAVVDGVRSNTIAVTVNPAVLTLTPPADATYSQTADAVTKLCSGGVTNIVMSGASIKFSDSSVVGVDGQPVTISVTSISNGIAGFDSVILYMSGYTQSDISLATNAVTSNTDTAGVWLLPMVIEGLTPTAPTGKHVFTVNWEATTSKTWDTVIVNYRVTKQSMLTLSCT